MIYTISHKTTYTYSEPVSLCHNIVKLLPRDTDSQVLRQTTIDINPVPEVVDEYEDFFGNKIIHFSIEKEHRQLSVNVITTVEKKTGSTASVNEVNESNISNEANEMEPGMLDIRQYIPATPMTAINEDIESYAQESFTPGRSLFEATEELMHRIYEDFEFKPGFTTIATPVSMVMLQRKGVCQDFAHLAIACVRSMGLPARYVSGYIETISPEGTEKLIGVDASHAWFSVYIAGMGWVDFDPTNNVIPTDQHVTIGWGRDYADIAPFKGVILSSGSHELAVSVDMRRG